VSFYAVAQQALAADGAIACFSSNLFQLSSDADRAPQLKRSVRLLLSDPKRHMSYECPVCSYPALAEPPYSDGSGSDEICPSCGFQFGVSDDSDGISFDEWRESWIDQGMPWNSRGIRQPPDWDPKQQLLRVKT